MRPDGAPLFYLDLNDDALIRDIVSGVYTGTPEAHDIQNLYPFGALISGLYRLFPEVPWFGALLFGLQLLCALLILGRALALLRRTPAVARGRGWKRVLGLGGALLAWFAALFLALPHFFFVQYSVTVGFLACAAAFLFVTGERPRHFAWGTALVGLGYLIRSEMLLLLLPLVLLALLFRYIREVASSRAEHEELPGLWDMVRYPFVTDHYRCYGLTLAALFLVLAVAWSLDRIGYASQDWDRFVRFFDARTEVYDFTGVPPYEGHEDFYGGIGLSEAQAGLLENYNFGLDEAIGAETMEAVGDYARTLLPSAASRLLGAIAAYRYRLHHAGIPADHAWPQTDAPWNLIAGVLYLALLLLSWFRSEGRSALGRRLVRCLWQPGLLFLCRSALWLWLLMNGRLPVRLAHPLYYVELSVLAGTLLVQLLGAREEVLPEAAREAGGGRRIGRLRPTVLIRVATLSLVLIIGLVYLWPTVSLIRGERERRREANAPYEALERYCAEHPEDYYFLDVYSQVAQTRPLFREADRAGRPRNLDLLGGWAVKSPAWRAQLEHFGLYDAEEGLLAPRVHFVADAARDVSWVEAYYREKGRSVTVAETDAVETAGRTFIIYDVR